LLHFRLLDMLNRSLPHNLPLSVSHSKQRDDKILEAIISYSTNNPQLATNHSFRQGALWLAASNQTRRSQVGDSMLNQPTNPRCSPNCLPKYGSPPLVLLWRRGIGARGVFYFPLLGRSAASRLPLIPSRLRITSNGTSLEWQDLLETFFGRQTS
jgi:hypothetical protein